MNTLQNKDFTPMETTILTPAIPSRRCPAPGGQFPPILRISGYSLALAGDIPALEACLALERAQGAQALVSEGIHTPPAVPYCEFLMLRGPVLLGGQSPGPLLAVCRLMKLDRRLEGANPIPNPLASGRFHLSPLLTALRYSREGILEMGSPAFAAGCDRAKAARLLWHGMTQYLERNGFAFVIGRDALPAAGETRPAWNGLMAAHGLPPDLETETRPDFRAWEPSATPANTGLVCEPGSRLSSEPLRLWPAGLQEALLQGCRLACEPAWNPASAALEFIWVASRDMLGEQGGDWRGAGA